MPTKNYQYEWPVLGNETLIQYLQTCLSNQNIIHAYLFYGPEHIGKKLVAENFVASLQCQSKKGRRPCGQCTVCQQIEKRIHPDIYYIEPQESKNITIDQIRALQHALSLRSFLTAYKIAVIDKAETMTLEAANSLLKTLEEPPLKTIIILMASKLSYLPITIISRCQILQFNFVVREAIFNWLIQQGKDRKEAREISHLAEGRPGIAYILANNAAVLEDHKTKVHDLLELISMNIQSKFNYVNTFIKREKAPEGPLEGFLDILISIYRDIILIKNNSQQNTINFFIKEKLNNLSVKYNSERLREIIIKIQQTKYYLKLNVNPLLTLENLMLAL